MASHSGQNSVGIEVFCYHEALAKVKALVRREWVSIQSLDDLLLPYRGEVNYNESILYPV